PRGNARNRTRLTANSSEGLFPWAGGAGCRCARPTARAFQALKWHTAPVGDPQELDDLTAEQRAWAIASEARWRRAHELAARSPGTDPGDVYHALRCLELSP